MTAVRFDIIDKQIAWAEKESKKGSKSKWDQNDWGVFKPSCGTAFCVAGHIANEAGYRPSYRQRSSDPEYLYGDKRFVYLEDWAEVLPPEADVKRDEYGYFPDDLVVPVDRVADEILGIEALRFGAYGDLFEGRNTITDLKQIRDEYAEAEGEPRVYTDENGELL